MNGFYAPSNKIMICNNCPDNCIEPRTTLCLAYEGPDIPSLDIECGDSFNSIIEKLKGVDTTTSVIPSVENTYQSTMLSEGAKSLLNTSFTYEITKSGQGYIFSWDIPVQAISTFVTGPNTSRNLVDSFKVTKTPSVVQFNVTVNTSTGNILLNKEILVDGTEGSFTAVFNVTDISKRTKDMSQSEAITQLLTDVSLINQQLSDLKATNVQSSLIVLEDQIKTFSQVDPLAEVTYKDRNVDYTKSVGQALTDIYTLIREVEAQLNLNTGVIENLKFQINNLPTSV
jgi:hypothetical protein